MTSLRITALATLFLVGLACNGAGGAKSSGRRSGPENPETGGDGPGAAPDRDPSDRSASQPPRTSSGPGEPPREGSPTPAPTGSGSQLPPTTTGGGGTSGNGPMGAGGDAGRGGAGGGPTDQLCSQACANLEECNVPVVCDCSTFSSACIACAAAASCMTMGDCVNLCFPPS